MGQVDPHRLEMQEKTLDAYPRGDGTSGKRRMSKWRKDRETSAYAHREAPGFAGSPHPRALIPRLCVSVQSLVLGTGRSGEVLSPLERGASG